MFRAILYTQWKWTRGIALLLAVAGFSIPLASLQAATAAEADIQAFLATMSGWGTAYALLAAAAGLLVALAAWGHDHQGRHVYALSLPVTRARYVMLRFGAGLVLLLPAVAGVLAGSIVVGLSAIPFGLHVFPIALTLRFAFCALLAYALFFAIGSSTTRTAAIVLGAIGGLFFAQYLVSLTGLDFNLLEQVASFLFLEPGILSVFTGRWMLIDV